MKAGEKIARETISGQLWSLLLDRNIFSNQPIDELPRGGKAVKIYHHPEQKDLLVILTNEHAVGSPVDKVERIPYVKSTSEKGKLFSVNTLGDLNAFLNNTLSHDLGISQWQ